MKGRAWITLVFSWMAGFSDTTTGIGLIALPTVTLGLMGVDNAGYQLVMIRFIGAFVFGTGSLYLWGTCLMRNLGGWNALKYTWLATAWLRGCVAVVTTCLIWNGQLAWGWWPVPVMDGILALFQVFWVKSGRFPVDA